MKSSKIEAGFTLVEVLVALAIVATAVLILLYSRQKSMDDIGKARMLRATWELAQSKIGEIGLDRANWGEGGTSGSGAFEDLPWAAGYSYDYSAAPEDVPTNDPNDPNQKPKKVYRLRVTVRCPDASLAPVAVYADLPYTAPAP